MRSDACVTVTCDRCGNTEEITLCALAGGGWDERHVDAELRNRGWRKDDEGDICDSCAEEEPA